MDKEAIERECREAIARYSEELRRYEEFLGQFVSLASVEPGIEIESPKRQLSPTAINEIREAEEKLAKLGQKMDEACDRLYEAYHH